MDFYVDIEILENPDIQMATLLSTLFGKFHSALVSAGDDTQIGISFPRYLPNDASNLGNLLRLHANERTLIGFMAKNWYATLADYISISNARAIPSKVNFAQIKRVQIQSNAERLRRRFMKRHNVDADTAKQKIPDSVEQTTKLPWLQVRSASTGQSFRLFINVGELQKAALSGSFNRYGLSPTATVPIF
jgi:CRISPR-associated endonuclease Csy4